MRTVSAAARAAMQARETGEAFLVFLTLTHPSLPEPIRVVNDGVDHEVGPDTYLRFPFEITLPAESEDRTPTVQLEICNVDRSIVRAVRSVTGPPIGVSFFVALASSPTVVEAGPFEFALRNARYDALTVAGTLAYEDLLNSPCPPRTMNPTVTPGLF